MAYDADKEAQDLTSLTDAAATDFVPVLDDPSGTPTLKQSTVAALVGYVVTAAGDLLYATASRTLARLAKGTARQLLAMNSGATAPEWVTRIRYVELEPFSFVGQTTCATGDGKAYLHIPADLDGLSLVEVHAENETAGTTGTMSIQFRNVTQAVDMLSTLLTIDTGETGSDTAAAAAVIKSDGSEIVAENDMLAIDVDAVHTTEALGLLVTLGFA
jgi:hypothetical protein